MSTSVDSNVYLMNGQKESDHGLEPCALTVASACGCWALAAATGRQGRGSWRGGGAELSLGWLSTWAVCFKNSEEDRQEIPVDYG